VTALRWGLLSTARIGGALAHGARATDAAEVVSVASRDEGRARAHAALVGASRWHGSYEALLADPDLDAVYNPLPNSMHAEWSIKALQAGKHVLCEKPLGRRVADVEEAFDAADASGRVLAEGFMWRHTPQAAKLRELLDSGAIGTLRSIRAGFSFPLTDQQDIRMLRALDGGSLMDLGCYCVSGARFITGAEPERVHGEQVIGGDGVDVAFAATLRFPGDVLAQFECSFQAARRHDLEAVGEEGVIRLSDPWHGREPVIELRRDGDDGVERIEVEAVDAYAAELEEFARVAAGSPPRWGREDALAQAAIIQALYASAEAGETP